MRRLPLALPLLLLLPLAAACSDDGDDGDDEAREVAPADAPFCDAFGALLTGPLSEDAAEPLNPTTLEAAITTTDGLIADLQEAAPEELQDAATTLAGDYGDTFAVLERYGYDLVRVQDEATPEDQQVLAEFGEENNAAFDDIQAWVADHCAPDVTLPDDLTESTDPESTATTSP